MLHFQPKIWRKIHEIGGDISPASLAFRKYAWALTKCRNDIVVASITKEVTTITKEVSPITKEVTTITKEAATITKEVATITKLFWIKVYFSKV